MGIEILLLVGLGAVILAMTRKKGEPVPLPGEPKFKVGDCVKFPDGSIGQILLYLGKFGEEHKYRVSLPGGGNTATSEQYLELTKCPTKSKYPQLSQIRLYHAGEGIVYMTIRIMRPDGTMAPFERAISMKQHGTVETLATYSPPIECTSFEILVNNAVLAGNRVIFVFANREGAAATVLPAGDSQLTLSSEPHSEELGLEGMICL